MAENEKASGARWNLAEAAEFFGVRPSTIREWVRKGAPYTKRGSKGSEWEFASADFIAWRIDHMVKLALGDLPSDRSSLSLRKLRAETELAEAKRDRFMMDHIPAGMFVEAIRAANAGIDGYLDSIANEAAPLVAKETSLQMCQRIIERAVNNARRRIVSPEARASLFRRLGVEK